MSDTLAPPLPNEVDVAVVGSGFAGLCTAIRLRQAGWHDFVLLEQAERVGGTWRDNHYPGAACDIPSSLYSFSFEANPRWTRVYPQQGELQAYLEHCVRKYGLGAHLHCRCAVTEARYEEHLQRWRVRINGERELLARVLVLGTGALSRPALPDIVGLAEFAGPVFHSARWRHDVALAGQRVAVIGTGASAIQFVPQIAPEATRLTLFQRTAPWVMPKPDRALTAGECDRRARFPRWQQAERALTYLHLEAHAVFFTRWPGLLRRAQVQLLRYLHREVRDARLREQLTPPYVMGCKRILLSNDFYAALRRPNVGLVTEPIERIGPAAVHTRDGAGHAADVIILATGFQAAEGGSPFPVVGRAGVELNGAWAGGAQAYLGTTVAGFPNLFLMTGPNTGVGHNSMVYMIESQVRYVLDALGTMRRQGLAAVDVDAQVQRDFNARLQTRLARTVWATGGCRSWYLTRDGRNTTLWPGFTFAFRRLTRRFDLRHYRAWPVAGPTAP